MSKELVQDAIIGLLLSGKEQKYRGKEFYAQFLLNMRKIYTDKVPTAGVNITDKINLYINPEFFAGLTELQRIEVLEHECKHIIEMHPIRGKNISKENHKDWNIACDSKINGPLTSLHEMGVTEERLAKEIKGYISGGTSEYVYSQIRQERQRRKQNGEGEGKFGDTVDDHSMWEDGEAGEVNEDFAKNTVKKALEKAVEKCGGAGNVPSDVQAALNKLRKSSVNWKQQLRRFFCRYGKFSKINTRKRRNRRFGLLVSGKKVKPHTHIAIAVDTSGSVSDDELEQFFSEIKKIHANGVKMTIIEADCVIKNMYEYDPKKPVQISGRGGTAYMPAIQRATELEVDGLIYFGDGDIFNETLIKPKFPVLWALVRNSPAPATWGSEIRVKVEQNV
jgi:predicted metal-dependent peptidase